MYYLFTNSEVFKAKGIADSRCVGSCFFVFWLFPFSDGLRLRAKKERKIYLRVMGVFVANISSVHFLINSETRSRIFMFFSMPIRCSARPHRADSSG